MISKSKFKLIKSLKNKKAREESNLFLVEGIKGILEVLKSKYLVECIVISDKVYAEYKEKFKHKYVYVLPPHEIKKLSTLKNNEAGLVVVKLVKNKFDKSKLNGITLALDSISDPGNLGTIIRNADWFGIKNIICSTDTVDLYNPKVIQSSMGSFTRVNVFYIDLVKFFSENNLKVWGTSSHRNNSITNSEKFDGVILFGNESNGINKKLMPFINNWISIKKIGEAESLNVSVSTGIILNQIKNN